MLFLFLLLVGCGHQHDARETTVSFSFEKKDQSLLLNPNRFVLFAHDQNRLQRAKVLVPGSNVLTLPNGSWKFSIFGFGQNIAGGSSEWLGGNEVFCGRTIFYNLTGTPLSITIPVSTGNCNSAEFNNQLVKIVPSSSGGYFFRWILPQGSRDQIDNEQLEDSFVSPCASTSSSVHMPRSLGASVKFPYYLILKIYTSAECVDVKLTASLEFDGDITKTPSLSLRNVSRASGSISIIVYDTPNNPNTIHTVDLPALP